MTSAATGKKSPLRHHLDALAQPVKDIREALTLQSKWKDIQKHLPAWTKMVDFKTYRNGCLLDVGCHYGLISAHFVQQTGKPAYGFDVNPQINRLLRKNIPSSAYAHAFHVMGYGLSDYTGKAQSYRDTKYSGGTTIDPAQLRIAEEIIGIHLKKNTIVEVRRLDDIQIPTPIALIKIDCEGSEANVLRGGEKTIARERPAIIFEALTREKYAECEKILKKYGYATRALDSRNFISNYEGK